MSLPPGDLAPQARWARDRLQAAKTRAAARGRCRPALGTGRAGPPPCLLWSLVPIGQLRLTHTGSG